MPSSPYNTTPTNSRTARNKAQNKRIRKWLKILKTVEAKSVSDFMGNDNKHLESFKKNQGLRPNDIDAINKFLNIKVRKLSLKAGVKSRKRNKSRKSNKSRKHR